MAFTADKVRQGVQQAAAGGYSVDNSLRFNDDDSAYLSWTPSSAGNRKTWTWSGWVKRGNITLGGINHQTLFSSGTSNAQIRWSSTADRIDIILGGGFALYAKAVQRDCSSWYHIIVSFDTTQATNTDRVKIYFNGELADRTWTNHPSQNTNWGINNTEVHNLSRSAYDSNRHLDGYLAEVHFIDGQALDPTSFGETGTYGEWKPIEVTGMTYGTNGFYLDFSNSGSLGTDASSNTNNWTVNNLAATDQMLDSPTNNFCTGLPLWRGGGTFSEGNLKLAANDNNSLRCSMSLPKDGKRYWEAMYGGGSNGIIGIKRTTNEYSNGCYTYSFYSTQGLFYRNGSGLSAYDSGDTTYGSGDILGFAWDGSAGTLAYYKNGSLIWTETTIDDSYEYVPANGAEANGLWFMYNFGQDSSFAGNKTAQGNQDSNSIGDFYYTPPTDFLALCTSNLPDPAVIPSEHFNTVLYTGNSGTNRTVTGAGFQPDLAVVKSRSASGNHQFHDSIRGASRGLFSNSESAEVNSSNYLVSFDSDGYTTNAGSGVNASSTTYVTWLWKANGTGVSNTNGSITSTVSANADAGFSIVSWTGSGGTGTIGHGLSSAPEMIIGKSRDKVDWWPVYHHNTSSYPAYNYMQFDGTGGVGGGYPGGASAWNNTEPTSSVFSIGAENAFNRTGDAEIAYCFHSVDGYSKVGSYTGNGSTDGTFVYTGFRPAYVMMKRTDSTGDWYVWDSVRNEYNLVTRNLVPNKTNAEFVGTSNYTLDFTSNGFKHRGSGGDVNASGGSYIYLAFAENPFKYTNAR